MAVDPLDHRRLWCHAFVVQRYPVTHGDFLAFANDLLARGEHDVIQKVLPQERPAMAGAKGMLLYQVNEAGKFDFVPDLEGEVFEPGYPAMMVDLPGAQAYGAWWAQQRGRPWRLVGELEFEKAGRGVSGSVWPFGPFADPSWYCMRDSHAGERVMVQPVGKFPADRSVYGVCDLSGNVLERCGDLYKDRGRERDGRVLPPAAAHLGDTVETNTLKGGTFHTGSRHARMASRYPGELTMRMAKLGFRIAYLYEPTAHEETAVGTHERG